MTTVLIPATRSAAGVHCLDHHQGWLCSRPAGHGGRHLAAYACGIRGQRVVAAVWGADVHAPARPIGRTQTAIGAL